MAQEEQYIAVVSERHSKPGDTRYIIINRQTREVMDDCGGHGYKSAASAHKSFAFKQRRRSGSSGKQGTKTVTIDAQTGVTNVNTWSGFVPRRQTSSSVGQVSPFVQEEMKSTIQPSQQTARKPSVNTAVGNQSRADQRPAANRQPTSLTSRFSPRQWSCQEDTPPPPPELFDFNK